jgi:hypothetical protein
MFRITWSLEEQAWQEARAIRAEHPPGSEWDSDLGFFYLLGGWLQLSYGGVELFPAKVLKAWYEQGALPTPDEDFAEARGHRIPVTQGAPLMLLDRAVQLARMLDHYAETGVLSPRTVIADDEQGVRIEIVSVYPNVVISSDFASQGYDAPTLVVPADVFLAEVRRFLLAFVGVIEEQVPELLDWLSTARLWSYRTGIGTGHDVDPADT